MRWFLFILFLVSVHKLQADQGLLNVSVEAQGAILINGDTGSVLFAKNPDALFFPASITKVATALYALKLASNRLEEKLIAKSEALATINPQVKRDSNYKAPSYLLETDGTHIGIKRGEEIRLVDLLYALMMRSANDAANVIAMNLGGTIPIFVDGMNRYLKEIGCTKTHFCNPHGFHHPDHVTSARDMSLIAKEAMGYPIFRKIVSSVNYTIAETNLHPPRPLLQMNLLMRSGPHFYSKAIGIKTGTTTHAGKTLTAAAQDKEGRLLIAVVLGYMGGKKDRYNDTIRLFESAFNEQPQTVTLLPKGEQKYLFRIPQARAPLSVYLAQPLAYKFYPSEKTEVKIRLRCDKLTLPITRGSRIGEIMAVDHQGRVLAKTLCYSSADVKPTLIYKLKKQWASPGRKKWVIAFSLFSGFSLLILFWKKTRTRR